MQRALSYGVLALVCVVAAACGSAPADCGPPPASASADVIGLGDRLAAGRLRVVNRQAAPLASGNAVRLDAGPGDGVLWIDGVDFVQGVIDADVCGRNVQSQSFVGLAFHRQRDDTFEAVYLRPFNFRSSSPDRARHAVQYVAMPDHDYAILREKSAGQFESAVDASAEPVGWNHLRLVIGDGRVRVFVGRAATPALDVPSLQAESRGQVGFFVGNGSDGAFANLRISSHGQVRTLAGDLVVGRW